MNITYEFFKSVMPSATMPSPTILDKIGSRIRLECAFLSSLLGSELASEVDGMEPIPSRPEPTQIESIADAFARLACSEAYRKAIPELDLVLTPNGFGVVSNQNQAPASRDRVTSLKNSLDRLSAELYDALFDCLRKNELWRSSFLYRMKFRSLFFKTAHLRILGEESPTLTRFHNLIPEITNAENKLSSLISFDQFSKICLAELENSASDTELEAVRLCRTYVASIFRRDGSSREAARSVLRFLEKNLGCFPEYVRSSVYAANHFNGYENKQEDSCFFFG